MLYVTTGILENTAIAGVRPTSTADLRITNDGLINDMVQIIGFYIEGTTKVQYVSEIITIEPGGALYRSYYANFDAFEFQFMTVNNSIQISVWGKDANNNLNPAHRVLPSELNAIPL
ncbi:hypothetical protein [Desulfosporosinus sp. BICA1-9]|uniref:hypothetical protein n=1 Tax=Desulfosporosinus sp. BICA1-9 TaxID=1531958 RepID=UPI00054B69FC|nr:hypothetical protein [Desulfosporosinus sp. BICA1-9]KJS48176.1 MAG: hypothetical protein VR66_15470 [Peptococcaceae bacterium BRH_c23]KJS89868.1 MAG: hypothetical protein JL57_05015 [Desulfosporosinus sp. BICA1-9]HBW34991.1 hypothetical protein [Desulfosporosinus sp.]